MGQTIPFFGTELQGAHVAKDEEKLKAAIKAANDKRRDALAALGGRGTRTDVNKIIAVHEDELAQAQADFG